MFFVGIDLAWGERNRDGLCLIEADGPRARVVDSGWTLGDAALWEWLGRQVGDRPCQVAVDAPLVCPNRTGSRPVDRQTHRLFGRQHAGCHPSNARLCARPLRIARGLRERGFDLGWDPSIARLAMEVYPHPAMLRWFGLERILKYKRGPVGDRRREFRRYQSLLGSCLALRFPELDPGPVGGAWLAAEYSKEAEDRLDACFCALIAWHHGRHQGRQSQVLGDDRNGFLVLPQ